MIQLSFATARPPARPLPVAAATRMPFCPSEIADLIDVLPKADGETGRVAAPSASFRRGRMGSLGSD